ncbi:MAG: filamentous hemagglutinin N-terminal domain-containing protein, partial [Pseudomonadota bacterium]|nr:filamentous hemagglutinin N-terminal domain-containing protein [Pseudomonadota bacterium]
MSNGFREFFTRRSPNSGRTIVGVWLLSYLSASTPGLALPQNGTVTGGEGTITQTSSTTMQIHQATQRMVADFTSFDIGANEAVNILQPGQTAVFLGNITGESATTIFGTLTANGQVVLINPRGVVFGENSRVDTAALLASTLGVDVDKFMSGALELEFSADSAGRIINRGVIQAASGGSVTLLGDEVVNEGLIVADLGRVNLASGSEAVVTFDNDGLIGVEVTQSALGTLGGEAAVLNTGTIEANGGQIFLTADAAQDLFDRAINNEGILRANTAQEVNGEIVLMSTGDTFTSGALYATNDAGAGGSVQVLGDRVAVTDGSIDVSGTEGGGEVLVGGDFRGEGDVPRADRTFVGADAEIIADATERGNGGQVVVWGNTEIRYLGRISAQGGAEEGDGGFVELSTRDSFDIRGEVNTSAANGETGTLLIDPTDIYIVNDADVTGGVAGDLDGTISSDSIVFADLDAVNNEVSVGALFGLGGTNITLEATNQITVGSANNDASNVNLKMSNSNTLTLSAGNGDEDGAGLGDITFVSGSRIDTGNGNLVLNAGQSGDTSGAITLGEVVTDTGGLTINAIGDVSLVEGTSSVGALTINAAGTVTNATGVNVAVAGNADLTGSSITLGNQASDAINFGSLTLNSAGAVVIAEDSATVLSGTSIADSLDLNSTASITDDGTADLTVAGNADLAGTSIALDDTFDFGSLTFNSGGSVVIAEDSATVLSGTSTADSLDLDSTAGITNAASASLTVTNNADLNGTSIALGDQTSDAINFGSLTVNSAGAVVIAEDLATVLSGTSTADSLDLDSTASITDDGTADLTVTGNADLAGTSIALDDTFGFGSLTFNSAGSVVIAENSTTVLLGTSTADSLDLDSGLFIFNAASASLTVTNNADLDGLGIVLGFTTGDVMNFGSLTLNSAGPVVIAEDSATILSGTSTADSLDLDSTASITDDGTADLTVTGIADLAGTSIALDDTFNFGSLTFNSGGSVVIAEDSMTLLSGTSTADSLDLDSAGILNPAGVSLTVTNNADLNGTFITLGITPSDINFGSLTLNSAGAVVIAEDSATVLSGTSTADSLDLDSTAGITNAASASLTVTNNADLNGTSIALGDQTSDPMNFGSLTRNSAGSVVIAEDSATVL